jgi:hypothetical protein
MSSKIAVCRDKSNSGQKMFFSLFTLEKQLSTFAYLEQNVLLLFGTTTTYLINFLREKPISIDLLEATQLAKASIGLLKYLIKRNVK